MASNTRTQCDACGRDIGLWQAAFTSECAHTFHLRCVSGSGACPACKAQWRDTPVVTPAPAPATPFSFASTPSASSQPSSSPSLFGSSTSAQPTSGASPFSVPSSTPAFGGSLFGPQALTSSNPFTCPIMFNSSPAFGSSSFATSSTSVFSTSAQPTSGSSPFSVPASTPAFGGSLFGTQPPATPSPFASSTLFNSSLAFGSSSFATSSSSLFSTSAQPTSGSSPFSTLASTPALGGSLFGTQPPASSNPFWLGPVPPTAQSSSSSSSCAVCHGAMGRGQATITSECNHMFHLHCLSGCICPVCGVRWRDEVTVTRLNPFSTSALPKVFPPFNNYIPHNPSPPAPPPSPSPSSSSLFNFTFTPPNPSPPSSFSLANFNDDEPVEPPLEGWDTVPEVVNNGVLILTTHCEHPAVARDAAQENFAVLVHAKAPVAPTEASGRAPLDLVTVLDVSSSMSGSKLSLLKQAMVFVIDKLGPNDRLSVVTFSCNARRIIRLTRMSEAGKASAKGAVESLRASGTTNIGDGLRIAAQVLDDRRHTNAVSSVILLSDGQDNHTLQYGGFWPSGATKKYIDLVPRSLRRGEDGVDVCTPVHTFGFGTDHDARAMHAVAEVTGGTFSFIENQAVLQDSFAQCIGGLLSVAVQEARIKVECLHPGVRVRAVKSGRYKSDVGADGRSASVDVGELYAEEERRFLLLLDVPIAAEPGDDGAEDKDGVTHLIKASCTYKDAATGRSVDVASEDAVVRRPVVVAAADAEPSMEVARERFRVEAAEDIILARATAERGEHGQAARILDKRQEASLAAGLAGDTRCAALVAELRELSARVADRSEYEHTGRAFMLAGMSSHAQQRASTVQLSRPAATPFAAAGSLHAGGGSCFQAGAGGGSCFQAGAGNSSRSPIPAASSAPFGEMAPFGAAGSGRSSYPFVSQAGGFGPSFFGQSTPTFGAAAPSSPFCAGPPPTSSPGSAAMPPYGATASCFTFGYATPAMQSMVDSSRKTREQQ